jgi:hypothetical protein
MTIVPVVPVSVHSLTRRHVSQSSSYLEVLHGQPPEQSPITLAPERLDARLPGKRPSAILFTISFLTLITDSAICQRWHVPPGSSVIVRTGHALDH